MKKTALISDCGKYRYELTREWEDGPLCVFVMLNPSTADASEDDPTIRRCIGYAKREGCGKLAVVNLFAYRATDPSELCEPGVEPIGPANNDYIEQWAKRFAPKLVIAAWGQTDRGPRAGRVKWLLRDVPLYALGVTKSGKPGHPLYRKLTQPLIPFNDAAKALKE